jgi:tRNA modification GTPase
MTVQDDLGQHADIICAPATPEGTSALALIRLSGKGSASLVETVMGLETGRLVGNRRKTGLLRRAGKAIDQVVAIGWPEGSSYTGEEMVELICHGVPGNVRGIMDCLLECGARRAEPGEFTRRAFSSGRMNALQVISLASLWRSDEGAEGIEGTAGDLLGEILKGVMKARESLEAEIEFQEEHGTGYEAEARECILDLRAMAERFAIQADRLEARTRVVLMGPVNSGKSTLFNILCGREQALVSEEPGTTRDGASCNIEVRGRRFLICDTAGAGGKGMDLKAHLSAVKVLNGTETVIWMSAGDGEDPPEEVLERAGEVIRVSSKSDLQEKDPYKDSLRVSAVTGEGIADLEELIAKVPGNLSLTGAAERVKEEIALSLEFVENGDHSIAAEHLAGAENEIRAIGGKGENVSLSVERALSAMCVGK